MSPLQPVDGLLAVVQRHDDEIQDSHVLTLENAIEKFAETNSLATSSTARPCWTVAVPWTDSKQGNIWS